MRRRIMLVADRAARRSVAKAMLRALIKGQSPGLAQQSGIIRQSVRQHWRRARRDDGLCL